MTGTTTREHFLAYWRHRLTGLKARWVGYREGDTLYDRDDVEFINAFNPATIERLLFPAEPTAPRQIGPGDEGISYGEAQDVTKPPIPAVEPMPEILKGGKNG